MKRIRIYEVIGLVVLLALTILAGVSCARAGDELAGKTWVLQTYEINGQTTAALTGHETTLNFDKEKMTVNGNGGVNGYGGDYTVKGSKITVNDVVHTLIASLDENLNKQESSFFKLLDAAETWEIAGNKLTIRGTEGTLVFLG